MNKACEEILKGLMNREFRDVFNKEDLELMSENRNNLTKIINRKLRKSGNLDIHTRVSLVNEEFKAKEVIALGGLKGNIDNILTFQSMDELLASQIKQTIIIFVKDNLDLKLRKIVAYFDLHQDEKFYKILCRDYFDIRENIINDARDGRLNSQKGKYLIFKPKDSKPYRAIGSKVLNREISDKNYGWYLGKNLISELYDKDGEVNMTIIADTKEDVDKSATFDSKIMEYEFYRMIKSLKISGVESIASIDNVTVLNEYLYIEREIERELFSRLERIYKKNQKKIVFLIGNSGDGKSRLLQKLKTRHSEVYYSFKIHNDATESFYVGKDSIDTLAKILEKFNDLNIDNGNEKYLIAINMGIIGKFIDSNYSTEYSKLIGLINSSNALKENAIDSGESDTVYEYISFSEYNIFDVSEKGINSNFIENIFDKVFAFDDANPFYQAYRKVSEDIKYNCPVIFNYESIIKHKTTIIKLLLLVHLEHNIMLTPRILWNFIYEIMMGNDVEMNYMHESDDIIEDLFYIRNLWFNRMFNKLSEDELIQQITKHVSLFENHKEIDQILQNFHTMKTNESKLNNFFESHGFPKGNKLVSSLVRSTMNDMNNGSEESLKMMNIVGNTIVRLYTIENLDIKCITDFETLTNYGILLNEINFIMPKKRKNLREFRKQFVNVIKTWNGINSRGDLIYSSFDDTKYRKSMKIDEDLIKSTSKEITDSTNRFMTSIEFEFNKYNCDFNIDVDFDMYKIIENMIAGYNLNAYERLDSIRLNRFIERIITAQTSNKEQYIHNLDNDTFVLKYDSFNSIFEFKKG